jgi:LPXTG-site transpeptidase (sortase) family protein
MKEFFIKHKSIIKIITFSLLLIIPIGLVSIGFRIKEISIKNIKVDLEREERGNYPKEISLWGNIEIPSLKVKVNLYKGSDELLKYGAIHHRETHFPSEGMPILIGASNVYFKNLNKLKADDKIVVNTIYGTYKYKVIKVRVRTIDKLKAELETLDNETLILYSNLNEKERVVVYAR